MMNNSKMIAAAILDFDFDLTIGFSILENHENDSQDDYFENIAATILDFDFDLAISFISSDDKAYVQ